VQQSLRYKRIAHGAAIDSRLGVVRKRFVERKVEFCMAVEAVERELRSLGPIAVDASEIAAELRKLDEDVLRELLARGALGNGASVVLSSSGADSSSVSFAVGGGDPRPPREAGRPVRAMESMLMSRLGQQCRS
jgi:hypothetical protein